MNNEERSFQRRQQKRHIERYQNLCERVGEMENKGKISTEVSFYIIYAYWKDEVIE